MGFKKTLLALALAGVTAVGLTACGGGSGGGKGAIIFANHNDSDAYCSLIKSEFETAARSAGAEVQFLDAKGDGNLQIDQLSEAIDNNAGAIVLIAVNGNSIVDTIKRANEKGIPVVITNRGVAGGEVLSSMSDNKEAGIMQGEFMAKNLPQGAKVVYLKGETGHIAAEGRWVGFQEACLNKRTDIQLLSMADAGWSRATAMKTMSLWLTMFPEINGVICGNDEMALGAIAALKDKNRLQGVLVSGVDATADALKALQAGELSQTVKQDAKGMAEGAFQLAKQSMEGGKPSDVVVPFASITRDNVAQFAK